MIMNYRKITKEMCKEDNSGSIGYIKLQWVAKIIHKVTVCRPPTPVYMSCGYAKLHQTTLGYTRLYGVTCSMPHRNFTRQRVENSFPFYNMHVFLVHCFVCLIA